MQSVGWALRALGARAWRPIAGAAATSSAIPAAKAGIAAEGAVGNACMSYSSVVGQALHGGLPGGVAGPAGRSLLPPIAQATQSRGISVDVRDNNTEGAVAKLKRKMISEGILKALKGKKEFIRPSKQRLLNNQERDKRIRKRKFKQQIKVILARRARCATPCRLAGAHLLLSLCSAGEHPTHAHAHAPRPTGLVTGRQGWA